MKMNFGWRKTFLLYVTWLSSLAAPLLANPQEGRAWPPAWQNFEHQPPSAILDMRGLPEGNAVVAALKDKTLAILDAKTGAILRQSAPFKGGIWGMELHPTKSELVVKASPGLHFVSLPDLAILSAMPVRQNFSRFALSPDGKRALLSGTKGDKIYLLELQPGAVAKPLALMGANAAWLPDSVHIALWQEIRAEQPPVEHEDNGTLTMSDGGTLVESGIRIYHSESLVKAGTLAFSTLKNLMLSRDARWFMAYSDRGEIDFWSAEDLVQGLTGSDPILPRARLNTHGPCYVAMFRDLTEWKLPGGASFDPATPAPVPFIPVFTEGPLIAAATAGGQVLFTRPHGVLTSWEIQGIDFERRWSDPLPLYRKAIPPVPVPHERSREELYGVHDRFGPDTVDLYRVYFDPSPGTSEEVSELHVVESQTGALLRRVPLPKGIERVSANTAFDGSALVIATDTQGWWPKDDPARRPRMEGLSNPHSDTAPSLYWITPGTTDLISDDLWLSERANYGVFSTNGKILMAVRYLDPEERCSVMLTRYDLAARRAEYPQKLEFGDDANQWKRTYARPPWKIRVLNNSDIVISMRNGQIKLFRYQGGTWAEPVMSSVRTHVQNASTPSSPDGEEILLGYDAEPAGLFFSSKDLREIGWIFPHQYMDRMPWEHPGFIRGKLIEGVGQEFRVPEDLFPPAAVFTGVEALYSALAVSPDGAVLAAAHHSGISLFDYKTGRFQKTLKNKGISPQRVVFLDNENLATFDGSNTWTSWNIPQGEKGENWTTEDRELEPQLHWGRLKFREPAVRREKFYAAQTYSYPTMEVRGGKKQTGINLSVQGYWLQLPGEGVLAYAEGEQMWLLQLPECRPIHVWDIPRVATLGYNPHTREIITGGFQGYLQKWKLPSRQALEERRQHQEKPLASKNRAPQPDDAPAPERKKRFWFF